MKNLIFFTFLALLFSGCLAKSAKPYTYYEMTYNQKRCVANSYKKENIYVDSVSSTNLADRREILVLDYKKQIRNIGDAKFVTVPSEMVYKAIVDALFSQCKYNPIFAPKEKDLRLSTNLMSLQVDNDQAIFTIAYELFNGLGSKKSGIITKKVFVKDPSAQSIFNSMNKAMNLAIDELMREIS